MKKRMMVVFGALALAGPVESRAAEIPELTSYLAREIAVLDGAVDDAGRDGEVNASSLDPRADQAWYLRQFWIRLRVPVGFEIPGIAKVTVIPETELLFERPNPEGWVSYKPQGKP